MSKLVHSPDSLRPQKSVPKAISSTKVTQPSSSRKPISKVTPEPKVEKINTSLQKKANKPSFHMSQTQGDDAVLPSYSRRSPGQDGGPLRGFSKFIYV